MNKSTRTALTLILAVASLTVAGCLSSGDDDSGLVKSAPDDGGGSSNSAPTISGSPGTSVLMGDQYSFSPTATDPDNDPLTFSVQGKPGWLSFNSGNGALTGTPSLADVGTFTGIAVSVSDGNLSANLPQFNVDVVQNADGSITLSWTAPTQNEDGSSLTDLAAYKFYYGTSPGTYTSQQRVDSPGITSYVLENLTPGTYYIAATAINSSNVESGFSNEATEQAL